MTSKQKKDAIFSRFFPSMIIELGVAIYGLIIGEMWLFCLGAFLLVAVIVIQGYKRRRVTDDEVPPCS